MQVVEVLAALEPDRRERTLRQLAAANGLRLTPTGPAFDLAALLDLPAYTIDPGGHSLS